MNITLEGDTVSFAKSKLAVDGETGKVTAVTLDGYEGDGAANYKVIANNLDIGYSGEAEPAEGTAVTNLDADGLTPVYCQLKWLHDHGVTVDCIQGAKTKDIIILEDEMRAVSNLHICTDDGSYGINGNVTVALQKLYDDGMRFDRVVAIGPMIMMKFVCLLTKKLGIETIVSMNPIMVDGTGMCGACRLMVGDKVQFACVDGPEFDGHLVDFDQAMARAKQYKTEEGRALLKQQEGDTHHGGCGHCGGDK
jgi:ferredoxin--NADP+ reductase